MLALAKKTIFFLIGFLNRICPKFQWAIVVSDCNDTSITIANALVSSPVRRVYLVTGTCPFYRPDELDESVRFFSRRTLRGYLLPILCRYVFFTHGISGLHSASHQTFVNLWHGFGYKKVGLYARGGTGVWADYTVVSSPLFQDVYSRSFGVPIESTLVIGLPRNDRLMSNITKKDEILAQAGIGTDFSSVIFWLPTFRKTTKGNRTDGVPTDNVFSVPGFDTCAFNRLLAENNSLCIVKPHPLAPVFNNKSLSNLKFIDEQWLCDHRLTLYPLLSVADCLISDVSSVMVDFCLLDRPIICMMADIEEYLQTRGSVLEPLKDWIPGPVAEDSDELTEQLKLIFRGEDVGIDRRRELAVKFNSHTDAHGTDRLIKAVFGG
jgi:CDP-glycerol glycerophosphotransferase (TagB/SpsB family)